ncbi:MAG: hypothetical protein K2N03_01410, partial [Muribaculaceae bacterium]|nr:hypothetical protein [Muribaculaceae bacterium]
IQTWGATKVSVVNQLPKTWKLIASSNGNEIYSVDQAENYPWYGFIYESDKLAGSSMYFTDQYFDNHNFKGYVAERYTEVGREGNEITYVNGATRATATTACVVEYDSTEDVWSATYMPVDHLTKAGNGNATVAASKALLKKALNK